MHPRILRRRDTVLLQQLAELDRDIKSVCLSLAPRVRLVGSLCIGKEEAENLDRLFQASVDYVIRIPAHSREGQVARRELVQKLTELEKYIESLLSATWAKAELKSRLQWEPNDLGQSQDRSRTIEHMQPTGAEAI